MSDRSTAIAGSHDTVWDLLPWCVNGTLQEEERRLVEAHLESCALCREELTSQRRLAESVADVEILDIAEQRHWERLQHRIREEQGQRGGTTDQADELFDRALRTLRRFWPVPAAAAVALALFVLMPPEHEPNAEFRTLTNSALDTGPVLRIKVAEGIGPDRLAAILAKMGAEIVEGPSPTGVYSARPTGAQPLEGLAAALGRHEDVVFSSVRPAP